MPTNKNALLRYKTLDRCLRNRYRKWTLDDLVDAVSDALYEMEGITRGVSTRTIQGDLQVMRSDKLGYNAPIEVYDGKYYRYSDSRYSITETPISESDFKLICKAIKLLKKQRENPGPSEIEEVLLHVERRLSSILEYA